jgi:hypothetical protein
MTVRCGTCAKAMGELPPLDCVRAIRGLCRRCFERGRSAAVTAARAGVRSLNLAVARADDQVLAWLAGELALLQRDVRAGQAHVILRAPVAARRARA